MRLTILILILFKSFTYCAGQADKEQKFNEVVQKVIIGFSKQDSLEISKLIKKDVGIYQLFRLGVYDNFKHHKALSFSDSTAENGFFKDTKGINVLALSHSKLPTYNCEKETWSKKGLFVDTTKVDHMLSKIGKNRNKVFLDTIPIERIRFFYELENKSRRIILYDTKGIELVFYLSFINNNWYLTIIDNVSSDCSV